MNKHERTRMNTTSGDTSAARRTRRQETQAGSSAVHGLKTQRDSNRTWYPLLLASFCRRYARLRALLAAERRHGLPLAAVTEHERTNITDTMTSRRPALEKQAR